MLASLGLGPGRQGPSGAMARLLEHVADSIAEKLSTQYGTDLLLFGPHASVVCCLSFVSPSPQKVTRQMHNYAHAAKMKASASKNIMMKTKTQMHRKKDIDRHEKQMMMKTKAHMHMKKNTNGYGTNDDENENTHVHEKRDRWA